MLNIHLWRRRMMQAWAPYEGHSSAIDTLLPRELRAMLRREAGAGGASARAAGRLGRVERRREVHPSIVCDSCQVAPRLSRALRPPPVLTGHVSSLLPY